MRWPGQDSPEKGHGKAGEGAKKHDSGHGRKPGHGKDDSDDEHKKHGKVRESWKVMKDGHATLV